MSGVQLPTCVIDIYPYEGGHFQITSLVGLLRACRVSQRINNVNSGAFEIALAPGGPYGPESSPQWLSIIRPMSLVVISMARAGRTRTVMIGMVRGVWERVEWTTGSPVVRDVQIQGQDFTYIFSMANFYGSLLFQFSSGALLSGGTPGGALEAVLSLGLQNTPLQDAAKAWFGKIMAGTTGLLSHMNFAYRDTRISFNDLMATLFGSYPGLKAEIPLGQNYAIMGGTWWDTFTNIYESPWFEFFITTADAGDYGLTAAPKPLQSSSPLFAPASPALVARPTPIPVLTNPDSPTFGLDMSLWNALPISTLDTLMPIERSIEFDESAVRNLFSINPTYIGSMFGGGNASNASWLQLFGCWLDSASIERYGYRPFVANLSWFGDPSGDFSRTIQAKGGQNIIAELVGLVALKAASYFEPLPLMASGSAVTNLRPDIKLGTRLEMALSKDLTPWQFYIEGVTHSFVFGGQSLTTLAICRGLPTAVYNDSALMTAMLSGKAMLMDGNYQIGLQEGAGASLKLLNLMTGPALTSQLAGAFGTPGKQ